MIRSAEARGSDLRNDGDTPLAGLGAYLVERGLIEPFALRRAEQAQARTGERLDLVLTRLGLMSEADMARALADGLGLALLGADELPAEPLLGDVLPRTFVTENRILPVRIDGGRLLVAMADPLQSQALEALAFLAEMPVDRAVAIPREIERAIARLYADRDEHAAGAAASATPGPPPSLSPSPSSPSSTSGPGVGATVGATGANDDDIRRLEDLASDAPVVRLVQELITRAVEAKASDIHIEPREDRVDVRLRIDGELHTIERLPLDSRAALASRVKVMARLDIAERRLPQDGRVSVAVRGRDVDLRVSTMPTLNGESLVLRILDRGGVPLDFASLGFAGAVLDRLTGLIEAPSGILLVTGPTGSGKTTTLYTALGRLDDRRRKIFTIEDPIEYQLPGISQVHVEPRIGLGFAAALRSILRQDPDILMVGEIRDLETAQMAIQASLTGHLVLSTVHTNSAAATIARLVNMGVENYLLASSLTGVVAQRLVRRLCDACAQPLAASPTLIERLRRDAGEGAGLDQASTDGQRLRRKVGCAACRGTGYAGRLSVNELLVVDAAMADAVLAGADERRIEAVALRQGMRTMYQDGVVKALLGETTMEEVLSATRVAA